MSKKFEPTPEQRILAVYGLSLGISGDLVRLDIINPETKKPIDHDTFCKVFNEEIHGARYEKIKAVVNVIYKKAVEDQDLGACAKFLSLNGRGCFNKRFEFREDETASQQISRIIKAAADGIIGAMEANEFVNAITKGITAVEFEEIKREFLEIKKENEYLRSQIGAKQ